MPDLFDQAQEQEALLRAAELRVRRRPGPNATGFCLNCGDEIELPQRWCNRECREDWAKREDE